MSERERAGSATRRSHLQRSVRAFLVPALLAVGSLATADDDLAKPLTAAQAALAAGDYAKAYPLYRQQADATGNPLAKFTVGLFHELGWGRPVDRREACRWFEQSAEGKIPAGEHLTGDCFRYGWHRAADPAGAARWYEQAASHGHLTSLCSLAELYVAGEGVPKDPAKGVALCLQAAQKGLRPAQVRVARFYLEGALGKPDYATALQILRVAAEGDDPQAQCVLGGMIRDGLGTRADADAAVGWFERAASQGYLPAYLPTARLYLSADRDAQTKLLPAGFLAKAYLWLAALARRSGDFAERAEADKLLADVLRDMPATWKPELDRKVDDHVARMTAQNASAAR